MTQSFPTLHDVIIAGAGPVGLFLACELRLAGVSVLILERAATPDAPAKALPFGLRGLSVASVESFDRRGLFTELQARAIGRDAPATAHWMRQHRRAGGHFAGIQFFQDQVDGTRWQHRLTPPAGGIAAAMAGIETMLTDRAIALGVEIRRGRGVDGFEAREDGVVVDASGERFRGRWLVGCDGGRSTVRKAAGIGFTGTDPEFTGYSVQVTLDDTEKLPPGRHYTATGMYTFTPPETIAMVDFDGGAFHRTTPTRDHVETVLRRVSGTDVAVTALHFATTWADRAHQATSYRQGRVLLAGDAAHIHSPLGGQGLNLGLGDATNLGWKLAATIRGTAPPGLLDSYAAERLPVGAQVLDWSRAQVALMRPSPASRALEAIVRDLIATPDGATYFAGRIWGVSLRYDLGSDHDLVGRSAPDIDLGGGLLNEHLRDGRGMLLDFGRTPSLRALADRRPDRLGYRASDAPEHLGIGAMLIRPDGIVAWATDRLGDAEGAEPAVVRWFGAA